MARVTGLIDTVEKRIHLTADLRTGASHYMTMPVAIKPGCNHRLNDYGLKVHRLFLERLKTTSCACHLDQRDRYKARIVPTILLHFLHPWRSDVAY